MKRQLTYEKILKAIKSKFTEAPFSAILKTEVVHIKSSTKWRSEYMILSQRLEDEFVVSIICNNLARSMSSSDIATFMQKDIKVVENIKKLGENTVPAYDVEQIIKNM